MKSFIQFAMILCLTRIISAVQCEHCGQDFVSLGRHAWRCKARVTSSARPVQAVDTPPIHAAAQSHAPTPGDPPLPLPTGLNEPEDTLCPCGRHCKGRRGLKAHQRSCGFFKSLVEGKLLAENIPDQHHPTPPPSHPSEPPTLLDPPPISCSIKPGLKLPKTKSKWLEANAYFHSRFVHELTGTITDLDSFVPRAQDCVYQYFADTCATIPREANKDFVLRYADYSIKSLKNALRSLKKLPNQSDASEIRYVSGLIRSKLSAKSNQDIIGNSDLDRDLRQNLWSQCRKLFDTAAHRIPTFSFPRAAIILNQP